MLPGFRVVSASNADQSGVAHAPSGLQDVTVRISAPPQTGVIQVRAEDPIAAMAHVEGMSLDLIKQLITPLEPILMTHAISDILHDIDASPQTLESLLDHLSRLSKAMKVT